MDQGIYIHVPFCRAKCRYCSFNSVPWGGAIPDAYVAALARDMEIEAERWADRRAATGSTCGDRFATVYFGGGTPSLAGAEQLEKLLRAVGKCFAVDPGAEITLECNPAAIAPDLAELRRLGVTRLSIGVQSLRDSELALLGRLHRRGDALDALGAARRAGFEDISADLMIGIPGQTPASLADTLAGIMSLVTHVSIYILSIEPGTAFEKLAKQGQLALADDETVAELYETGRDLLAEGGFQPYEISNYSLPGHACRHNQIYWRRGNYVGLGAGAHGHEDGWRYSKIADPGAYTDSILGGGDAIEHSESLSAAQMALEELMLGMRTERGVDLAALASRFGLRSRLAGSSIDDLLSEGYLVSKGNILTLSPKGVLLGDALTTEIAHSLVGLSPNSVKDKQLPSRYQS